MSFGRKTNRKPRTEAFTAKTDVCQAVHWVKPKPFFNKTAVGSGNDFAEVTEEMTLEKIKMWAVENFWTYKFLTNKSSERDFETIVYMLALFFCSVNSFWSMWNRQMKTMLISFIYEAVVVSIV